MGGEAISPNWHVLLIHAPIGLLTVGVLIELISLGWRNEGFRVAGRWMILLGALLSVPTAIAGVYAFRDAMEPHSPEATIMAWDRAVELSPWTADQWHMMERHAWFNAPATGLVVLVALVWLALSPKWSRRLYWPLLLLLVAGVGTMVVGSWYGGEAVYRLGTAVESPAVAAAEPRPGAANDRAAADHHGDEGQAGLRGAKYYLPPLQLHVVAAGFVLMLAFATLALTIGQWNTVAEEARPGAGPPASPPPAEPPQPPPARAWPWVIVSLVALGTAVAGGWSFMGAFSGERLRANVRLLGDPAQTRLLLHVIFGLLVFLLPLVLAILLRVARRRRGWASAIMVLLVLVAGWQAWLGLLMLFDGHEGPVFAFNTAAAAQKNHHNGADGDHHHAGIDRDGNNDAGRPAADVTMSDDMQFDPRRVTIDAGETVEWKNTDDIVHTVTADPEQAANEESVQIPEGARPFDSGFMKPGATFRHTFEVPGTYRYFCIPHERQGMIGEVEVRRRR